MSREIIYLEEKDVGLWTFHEYSDGVRVHVNMSKDCRGRKAVQSGLEAKKWIFENTNYHSIYALIPSESKHVFRIAVGCGMNRISTSKENYTLFEVKSCQ